MDAKPIDLRGRVRFAKALEDASAWRAAQRRAAETPAARATATARLQEEDVLRRVLYTVPHTVRPRSRGERRFLMTFVGVSLRPSLGFNP